jgi:hypothetical protein
LQKTCKKLAKNLQKLAKLFASQFVNSHVWVDKNLQKTCKMQVFLLHTIVNSHGQSRFSTFWKSKLQCSAEKFMFTRRLRFGFPLCFLSQTTLKRSLKYLKNSNW